MHNKQRTANQDAQRIKYDILEAHQHMVDATDTLKQLGVKSFDPGADGYIRKVLRSGVANLWRKALPRSVNPLLLRAEAKNGVHAAVRIGSEVISERRGALAESSQKVGEMQVRNEQVNGAIGALIARAIDEGMDVSVLPPNIYDAAKELHRDPNISQADLNAKVREVGKAFDRDAGLL
jgi:hypothetical protein